MTSIFKRLLIPGFLRRLDASLLVRNPVLWRTQAHFILFYALLGAVALFLAGFYADVSAIHLQVAPIKPIEMAEDTQYRYVLAAVLLACFPWFYRQYQAGYPFYKAKDTLLTLLVYTICFWVLLGITAPAYRLGTIYRTAWHWMDEKDLQRFEESGVYPYGFILLESDTIYKPQADSFYQRREAIFKEVWKNKQDFLNIRYETDSLIWPKPLRRIILLDMSDRLYLSDMSDRLYLSDMSYLSNMIYESSLSDRPYRLYRPRPSYMRYLSDLSYLSYISYALDVSDFPKILGLAHISDVTYLSYLSYLSGYYETTQNRCKFFQSTLNPVYKFRIGVDTIPFDTLLLIRPQLPNNLEDAVRSVKHARQYLAEGIYYRFFHHLRFYILFLPFFLFLLPFISLRHVMAALVIAVVGWAVLSMEWVKLDELIKGDFKKGYQVNVITFIILPLTGILLMIRSIWLKKQFQIIPLAIALLFTGLFLTLFPTLGIMKENFKNIGLPYNHAFFGVQALGLAGAFLLTYIQSLPKKT